MATRNLSIGLLREGVTPEDALVEDHNLTPVQTTSTSIPQAKIWVRERISSSPWWVNFLSIQTVANPRGADALAFVEVNQRWMYLSFGFANHKIKNSATSFDFGMKSAAILVNPDLLRVADSLEPNLGRRMRTQQAKDTSSKSFGIDARIALTRGIAGKPANDLGGKIKRVSGGAHLKISTRDNIEELPEILDHILSSYLNGQIPPELQNYLSLREVEDEATLNALTKSLIASINSDDVTTISLMIPDFVVPGERDCVKFSGYGRSKVYPDIFIGSLRDYLQSNTTNGLLDEEHLDSMKLIACNDEGQDTRDCIDPAESAQVKPLMRMPQRGFSCPAPDVGGGGCRS